MRSDAQLSTNAWRNFLNERILRQKHLMYSLDASIVLAIIFSWLKIPASRTRKRCYLDPVNLLYHHKGREIKEGARSAPKIARHCFISRRFSPLRSIRLSRLAPLCLLCTVFFPRCSPVSSRAFTYTFTRYKWPK